MDGEYVRNELLTSQWSGMAPGSIFYTGGNVGIGTSSPECALSFGNAFNNTNKVIALSSGPASPPETATDFCGFGVTGGNILRYQSLSALAGGHQWFTGATEVMRIGIGAGIPRVCIGSSSLQSKFSVAGNVGIGATFVNTAAPTNGLIVEGNVGIGTTIPQAPLHIYKTGTGGVVQGEIRVCSDDGQKSRVGMYEESQGSTWGCWMQYNGTGDTFEFGTKRNTVDSAPQMTISSTGTVSIPGVIVNPGRYYIMGYLAGGTTAGNYINLGSQKSGGGMTITTSNKLVAPVSGLYQFGFQTIMALSSIRNDVTINVNGASIVNTLSEDTTTGYHYRSASICYYLNVNDFVQYYCSSGTIYGAAAADPWHTFYFFHVG